MHYLYRLHVIRIPFFTRIFQIWALQIRINNLHKHGRMSSVNFKAGHPLAALDLTKYLKPYKNFH